MECVDGGTLSDRLAGKDTGAFEVEEIDAWVQQVCEALEYAHSKARIVHRDLKPANLMLGSRGDVKVADFGLARCQADSMSRVSMAGAAGTWTYMSPQQLMGADPTPADDIYSLGATLYELLTGRPPFYTGDISMQIRQKVPEKVNVRWVKLDHDNEGPQRNAHMNEPTPARGHDLAVPVGVGVCASGGDNDAVQLR